MTDIPTAMTGKLNLPTPVSVGPREVLKRVLFPFALFSVVLLSLLVLSWYLLLPRFTRVALHGVPQDPSHLQTYVEGVQAETKKMEDKRLALIFPLDHSSFGDLVQEKMSQPSLLAFYEQLKNVATTFLPEQSQAVFVQSISYENDVVQLKGDVRNVGLQSMAVVAQFVEAVRAMPGVKRVDFPSFTRERDENIGFHSPFVIQIHFS